MEKKEKTGCHPVNRGYSKSFIENFAKFKGWGVLGKVLYTNRFFLLRNETERRIRPENYLNNPI
ncbi:hypothetical protein J4457_06210 [Candidatus Woesearchaeota archaeon]|nr:hypothetical protein [Candidatus Woesearchaeota archaeon]